MRCRPCGEMHCTERRRGSGSAPSSAILFADFPLDELAGLDHGAAMDAVVVPGCLNAQLGKIARCLHEGRERDAELRLEAVLERSRLVVLGIRLCVEVAHHQPAQALAEILETPGAGDAHDRGEHCRCASFTQASYLNESARRARNCVILPSSILTSS